MNNTGNEIGSNDVLDFEDNTANLDILMNVEVDYWEDRFGKKRPTIDYALRMAGFSPAGFDFTTGGVLGNGDRNKAVFNQTDGYWYSYNGNLPYNLPPGSQPNSNWTIVIRGGITVAREALRRTYQEVGLNLVDGSFEQGGVLSNINDVLLQERTGKVFSGPVGVVAAGTNPASGGFVDMSASLLREYVLNTTTATFKNEHGYSAVENMIAGRVNGIAGAVIHKAGNIYSTGGTTWKCKVDVPSDLSGFNALTPVRYSSFGLRANDPTWDNYPELLKIHTAANASDVGVIGDMAGQYLNIGLLNSSGIPITTDCDWSGCKFRLTAASSPDTLYSQRRLFKCESPTIATLTQSDITIADFAEGALYLPSIATLGYKDVVIAVYSNDKYLERDGNPTQPIYKRELCTVFENGALASPLQFSYNSISSIEVYKLETKRLSLRNIQFLLEDDFKSAIGLYLQRNQTDLKGISVEELDNVNKNYSRNFIGIYNTYNTVVSFLTSNGFESGGGTYLLRPELTESCEVRNIKATNGWGVFGGNFNKNIKYFDCEVNRIDQHAFGQDCIIERCTIYGNSGVSVTGKGKLTINNCSYYVKANGLNLVTLRSDYASIWEGEVHLNSNRVVLSLQNAAQAEVGINVIEASILNKDFGTSHVFPSVFVDGLVIDSDASTTLVTCYNLPSNTGVNDQFLPKLAKFYNITTSSNNVRVRAAPPIVADQPKYKGNGMKFDLKNLHMDYNWVHSAGFDVTSNKKDAILYFSGANYSTGVPFNFSANVDECDNCAFVWTLPTPLRVTKCNGVSGMLTTAANGSGSNFAGGKNAVFVYDSSAELMNYRGNQEFMIESVNLRNVEFIKPSVNTQVGSYRSIKLNTIISGQGCLLRLDCPVVTGDESLINSVFTGVKKTDWRS